MAVGTQCTGAAPQTRGLINAMVTAFNAQLAAQLAGVRGVILADFYTEANSQLRTPHSLA